MTGVVRSTGAALALLIIASPCIAQTPLRLGDVLTSGTLTATPTPVSPSAARSPAGGTRPTPVATPRPSPTPDPASAVVTAEANAAEAALAAGNPAPALELTERMIRLLDPQDARYPALLHLRARALKASGETSALGGLAVEYLRLAPKGPHARWFLSERARDAAARGDWQAAARTWIDADMAGSVPLPAAEGLAGIEALGRALRPREQRVLFRRADWKGLPETELVRRDLWVLDGLLLDDDPNYKLEDFPPRTPGIRLRRALVMEMRGERESAMQDFRALEQNALALSEAERMILRGRLTVTPDK